MKPSFIRGVGILEGPFYQKDYETYFIRGLVWIFSSRKNNKVDKSTKGVNLL